MNNRDGEWHPLVSILINNYNYGHFIGEAIESALKQTYALKEIIVVDDGSTDNSRDVIAGYEGKITAVLKENGGQPSAFNTGFLHSSGEIICFLDSDDTFMPEKVCAVVEALRKSPDAGWCFHVTRVVDRSGAIVATCGPSRSEECDLRNRAKSGRLKLLTPSTSGISFRRTLLGKLLPMPDAPGIELSDIYLKCAAVALATGVCLNAELAVQRLHGNNLYTYRRDVITARVLSRTGWELRRQFPAIRKLANKLIASALYESARNRQTAAEEISFLNDYLGSSTSIDRSAIRLRALYHFWKWKLRNLRWKQSLTGELEKSK